MKQRIIKFRAWDGTQMHYTQDETRTTQSMTTAGDILNRFETVMQFTGLTDKNGKEIWEGDIIDNEAARWEVIFNTGCFCGKRIGGSDGTQDVHLALRAIKEISIIGNKFANP